MCLYPVERLLAWVNVTSAERFKSHPVPPPVISRLFQELKETVPVTEPATPFGQALSLLKELLSSYETSFKYKGKA